MPKIAEIPNQNSQNSEIDFNGVFDSESPVMIESGSLLDDFSSSDVLKNELSECSINSYSSLLSDNKSQEETHSNIKIGNNILQDDFNMLLTSHAYVEKNVLQNNSYIAEHHNLYLKNSILQDGSSHSHAHFQNIMVLDDSNIHLDNTVQDSSNMMSVNNDKSNDSLKSRLRSINCNENNYQSSDSFILETNKKLKSSNSESFLNHSEQSVLIKESYNIFEPLENNKDFLEEIYDCDKNYGQSKSDMDDQGSVKILQSPIAFF